MNMANPIEKLLDIASESLSELEPQYSEVMLNLAGPLADELLKTLRARNGFYAFESALHVFPAHSDQEEIGLDDWNARSLWIADYEGMADGCFFFAEDTFGGQFCIKDGNVFVFDPETGALDYLADDLDGWTTAILAEYEALTGYALAHEWQTRYGQIPPHKRLLPKIPFVAGGKFSIDNLCLQNAVEGMKFRAHIANQIKELPDGAQVEFEIVD